MAGAEKSLRNRNTDRWHEKQRYLDFTAGPIDQVYYLGSEEYGYNGNTKLENKAQSEWKEDCLLSE